VAQIALKLKINITTRLSVADYPYVESFFRVVGGHLADFGTFGKMLITPDWSTLGSLALRTLKENNFLYRVVRLEVKTERKIFPE